MAFYRCGGGADTSVVTAGAEDVLSPKVIVNADGEPITGTMANQGAKTATLSAGGSYTIPKGYHDGNGKVTADSLANQTSATATAEQILYNQTAYVNGNKVTGTMPDMSGFGQSGLPAGASLSIPKGYHNGSGKVTAKTLASQTSATATAAKIMKGYTAWVNGSKITGTRGTVTIDGVEVAGDISFKLIVKDTLASKLPYNFYQGSAVVYNNEIHILGGSSSSSSHYKWNGSSWSNVSTSPYSFYAASVVVYNNEIHILGGYGGFTTHYKWNGSSWSSVSTLPYNFYQGSAVVYNNEIHILGSGGSSGHYKWNGSSWSNVSMIPYELNLGSAVVYNNEIHILGSADSKTKHYKWNGRSWSSVSTLPYNFYQGSAVVYNNEIHILGGSSSSSSHYKWNGSSWSNVSTLPYSFYDGPVVVYNNEIHILGGGGDSDDRTNHYEINAKIYRKVV